ncbi:MAG: TolC family protein, partial [Flavobacteriaceae bacterium]|nr:TolC family protein [Flavobacteriaceae bacterium]
LVSIFEKDKITLEKNLYETQKIYENGFTEEESVEQLEITLLNIDTQLSNAIRSESIANQMFNLALGIDVSENVVLKDDLASLTVRNTSLSFLDSSLNLENNIDYKIASNLTQQRSLELKLEKSKALPSLSAFVNYGTSANSDSFSFFDSQQIWYQSSILGLKMNIPIFSSGMRGARTQQARIALKKAETDFNYTQQNILLELNSAKSNYQFAIEKYENAKKYLTLSERIESKNQVKFKEGLSTSFDLRQAQTQLYIAQQQYFQSMLEVITSKANLETILNSPTIQTN